MFGEMLDQVKYDAISMLSRIRIQSEEDVYKDGGAKTSRAIHGF